MMIVVGLAGVAQGLTGFGTEEDPWRIQSLADFDEFADDPNYWDDYTRLETDVNLAGRVYDKAVIAPDTDSSNHYFEGTVFTGVFDGNDQKLTGLTIDDGGVGNDYLGLFGHVVDGIVSHLGLEGGSVSGDRFIGGLVGSNDGSIFHCYCTCSVDGADEVGGLAGTNQGGVSNCYSSGDVDCVENIAGGLVGVNCRGSVSDCYSTSDVNGVEDVGGLVGSNDGDISDCNSSGTVRGVDEVGGLVGTNCCASILNCRSTSNVAGSNSCIGGLVGRNYNGDSIVSDCYYAGSVSGYRIVGGLVGINAGGVSDCHSTGDINGVEDVGGVVGLNRGSISDCDSCGTVSGNWCSVGGLAGHCDGGSLSRCYSKGDVTADNRVGGLVGLNEYGSSVSCCFSTGDVNGTGDNVGGLMGKNHHSNVSDCYCKGDVSGDSFVGGLMGVNRGRISDCYSTGDVSGDRLVGGLVGWNDEFEVSNCFWDTDNQTHGVTESIGADDGAATNVAGLPTSQLQQQSTFTGWDFINAWNIGENQTYPYLRTHAASDINKDNITNFLDLCIVAEQWCDEQ